MTLSRRYVLAGLLLGLLVVAGAILADVVATVFFAITVAYLLVPLHRRFVGRGLDRWWASVATALVAFVSVLLPLSLLGFLFYARRADLLAVVASLPTSGTLEVFGVSYTVEFADAVAYLQGALSSLAVDAVRWAGVLGLKVTLFALVVFALLVRYDDVGRAVLAPVPREYHDVARALHARTRATLFVIYVLQVATGFATFLVAVPVFVALGYAFPFTLAVVAGLLQFLPIVGPSVLVVALAAYQFSQGAYGAALAVLVVAGVLVAWLPDVLVRPRLARETADLSGSLYFIGFTGGLLTLGAVGIVAGPLIVALVAEATNLLADEVNGHPEQVGLDDLGGSRVDAEGAATTDAGAETGEQSR